MKSIKAKNDARPMLIELLLIASVVGVLGFVGYNTYTHRQYETAVTEPSVTVADRGPTATDVPDAPAIQTTEDLSEAEATLEDISIESSEEDEQLDAAVADL